MDLDKALNSIKAVCATHKATLLEHVEIQQSIKFLEAKLRGPQQQPLPPPPVSDKMSPKRRRRKGSKKK